MNEEEARDLARTDPARAALWFLRRGALVVYDSPVELLWRSCGEEDGDVPISWVEPHGPPELPACHKEECPDGTWRDGQCIMEKQVDIYGSSDYFPCETCGGKGLISQQDSGLFRVYVSCIEGSALKVIRLRRQIKFGRFKFGKFTPPLDVALAEEMACRVASSREAMIAKTLGIPSFICEKCGQWSTISNPCEFCV